MFCICVCKQSGQENIQTKKDVTSKYYITKNLYTLHCLDSDTWDRKWLESWRQGIRRERLVDKVLENVHLQDQERTIGINLR